MNTWWTALEPRARSVLLAAAAALALLLGVATWWLLRGDPAVLFADLRPQDAATMAAELERLKIPYRVGDDGASLIVDRAQVHAARMKLMGRDLPLQGAVGFELFNTSDFGMTEFAQKVNYQRALQGELTRTILSFAEIREARVHLALPEQGLFRQNTARAKAAVTVGVRPGHVLRPEQVSGIQRLVAAAVPSLLASEVTVVDQQGMALTRASDSDPEAGLAGGRLDLKRETENHLSRKAGLVLERAFGPGQALASVDVTLNMDQVKVTTEDVLAAPDVRGAGPTGVLVRERESARDSAGADARNANGAGNRGSSMQRDVEYQAGRRVEQVVSQPGAIRRLHVVALVRTPLTPEQRQQVRELVSAAVGAAPERGDVVVVQVLGALPAPTARDAVPEQPAAAADREPSAATAPWWAAAAVGLLLLAVTLTWRLRRRQVPRRLSPAERELALQRVQGWLLQATSSQAQPVHGSGRKE